MVTDGQCGIGLCMPDPRRATTVLGVVLCLERIWDGENENGRENEEGARDGGGT